MDDDDITPVYTARSRPRRASQPPRLLSLSPVPDRNGRPILLLHSEALTYDQAKNPLPPDVQALIRAVESKPHVLVYLHAGVVSEATPSILAVRAFRAAYESLISVEARKNLASIILLHVSFVTRAHIYASSFAMKCADYSRIQYCDLLVDLEAALGVEPLLLGLRDVDLQYDETMRFWVDRQNEARPGVPAVKVPKPDPSKPLLDVNNISFDRDGPLDIDPGAYNQNPNVSAALSEEP